MEYIVVLMFLIVMIVAMFFVFNVKIKKIKEIGENKELDDISLKFPENKEICKSVLKKLNNKKVKIKEDEEGQNKTSLYIAITDTIFIGDIKKNYTRIQTICHECLHSIQDRKMLLFNFIFSNIYIIYFITSILLTIFKVFKNFNLQIIILTIMGFIYYAVRSYLETDAMTKAEYIAKEYMNEYIEENNKCNREDVDKISEKYKELNKLGIPATNFILIFNCVIKVIIYIALVITMEF